jgi:hypothetical protein
MNYLKQTQTKPNLSAYMADKFALSLPNGPIKNTFFLVAGKFAPLFRMPFILRGE